MAIGGLTGLNGLGPQRVDESIASPEDRMGGPADPRHGVFGEQAKPYSWQSQLIQGGTLSRNLLQDELPDEDFADWVSTPAGNITEGGPYIERAPWTHAGPWPSDPIGDGSHSPKNIIDRQVLQNYQLRGLASPSDFSHANVYGYPALQDQWTEIWQVDPGNSDLEAMGPQARSGLAPAGRGNTDRTQSNARQNQYGYDSKHWHRRIATGSIPGNYMWMRPGGRFSQKTLPGPARPAIGEGSPFEGDNLGASFSTQGAILTTQPTEYQAPPEPYIAPYASDPSLEGTMDMEFY